MAITQSTSTLPGSTTPAASAAPAPPPAAPGFHGAVSEFKRRLIESTLCQWGGNRTRTARALGLQRTYLLRLIREFGVTVPHAERPVRRGAGADTAGGAPTAASVGAAPAGAARPTVPPEAALAPRAASVSAAGASVPRPAAARPGSAPVPSARAAVPPSRRPPASTGAPARALPSHLGNGRSGQRALPGPRTLTRGRRAG